MITGTDSDDVLTGTNDAEMIDGRGGNDRISALGGNDTLSGGLGDDQLFGGEGEDGLDGGPGNDILSGGGGIDFLVGGLGADTFIGTTAEVNGDRIYGFDLNDRIVITDADLANFTVTYWGGILTFPGGSLWLNNEPAIRFIVQAAAEGGVEITTRPQLLTDDFNDDGFSDFLLRNSNGTLTNWLGQADGTFVQNDANLWADVPLEWQIVGTGDFNGDGGTDILWRDQSGTLTSWLAQDDGSFVANNDLWAAVPTDWSVVGTGDFNGDGRADILWRHSSGTLTNWLGQADGDFWANGGNVWAEVPTDWHVISTGDYDGNGRQDVLWRHDDGTVTNWLGQQDGTFVANDSFMRPVPNDWHLIASGDFDGYGRSDLLWRNDNGNVSVWYGQPISAESPFAVRSAEGVHSPTDWHIVSTGDYNGDSYDDILWRRDDGTLTSWLSNGRDGFEANDALWVEVPTTWQVQSPDTYWL